MLAGLLERFAQLQKKAQARTGRKFPIIVIREAGLDGFADRSCVAERKDRKPRRRSSLGCILTSAPASEDCKIDGEALLRTLLAYKRGEPRLCAMVKAPTPEEEDRRRLWPSAEVRAQPCMACTATCSSALLRNARAADAVPGALALICKQSAVRPGYLRQRRVAGCRRRTAWNAMWLIPLTQVALDVVCCEVGRVRSPGRTPDG